MSCADDPTLRHFGCLFGVTNNRMVVFGGMSGVTDLNQVWSLSLSGSPTWSQLSPTGTGPGIRSRMGYASNASGSKLYISGGSESVFLNAIFVLDLSTTNGSWTNPYVNNCSDSAAPACRRSHNMFLDESGNRLIVTGGRDGSVSFDDTYSYDLTTNTWTNLAPADEILLSVPVTGLASDSYHWRYRVNGSTSGAGAFTSFGQNSDTPTAGTDFTLGSGGSSGPTLDQQMRGGQSVIDGTKAPFSW